MQNPNSVQYNYEMNYSLNAGVVLVHSKDLVPENLLASGFKFLTPCRE